MNPIIESTAGFRECAKRERESASDSRAKISESTFGDLDRKSPDIRDRAVERGILIVLAATQFLRMKAITVRVGMSGGGYSE